MNASKSRMLRTASPMASSSRWYWTTRGAISAPTRRSTGHQEALSESSIQAQSVCSTEKTSPALPLFDKDVCTFSSKARASEGGRSPSSMEGPEHERHGRKSTSASAIVSIRAASSRPFAASMRAVGRASWGRVLAFRTTRRRVMLANAASNDPDRCAIAHQISGARRTCLQELVRSQRVFNGRIGLWR